MAHGRRRELCRLVIPTIQHSRLASPSQFGCANSITVLLGLVNIPPHHNYVPIFSSTRSASSSKYFLLYTLILSMPVRVIKNGISVLTLGSRLRCPYIYPYPVSPLTPYGQEGLSLSPFKVLSASSTMIGEYLLSRLGRSMH